MTDLATRALKLAKTLAARPCRLKAAARGITCPDIFFYEKHWLAEHA